MKHLIISLFLSGGLFSGYAQIDSIHKAPVAGDTTPVTNNSMTNNNTMRNDSTGSMNNSMRNDNTETMNNTMRSDSSGSMNHTMRSDSTGNMNNSMRSDSSEMNSNNANTQNNMNSSSNANTNSNAGMQSSSTTMSSSWNIQGQPGYASLPVLESYVPEDVVSKIRSKYISVYDISAIKHTADQGAYAVRYNDNGVFKTEIIGADGNTVQ